MENLYKPLNQDGKPIFMNTWKIVAVLRLSLWLFHMQINPGHTHLSGWQTMILFPVCVHAVSPRTHGARLRVTPSRDPSPLWSLKMLELPWTFTNWYVGLIRRCNVFSCSSYSSWASILFIHRSWGLQVSQSSAAGRSRRWVTTSWRKARTGLLWGTRSWPSWFTTRGVRRSRTAWGAGCCWPVASVPSLLHPHWTNHCSSRCYT